MEAEIKVVMLAVLRGDTANMSISGRERDIYIISCVDFTTHEASPLKIRVVNYIIPPYNFYTILTHFLTIPRSSSTNPLPLHACVTQ